MTFQVELVSPEAISYSGEAEMIIARTLEGGDIAFQPGHVPFIGVLAVWSVDVVRPDGNRDTIAVHQGFVQVAGTRVTILSAVHQGCDQVAGTRVSSLSDGSEPSADIDVDRARAAKGNAEAALTTDRNNAESAGALARAELRLRVAGADA